MRHMNFESGQKLRELRETFDLSQAKLAEISGVPQHILSSYELEKLGLDEKYERKIKSIFNNPEQIQGIVQRKKRYRKHTYIAVRHLPERLNRYCQTIGNKNYLDTIRMLNPNAERCGLKAISIFAGCGGLSLGFRSAGFDLTGYLEVEDGLRSIYSQNFPHSTHLGNDITKLSVEEILQDANKIGPIDVIIGGPPCQGFSLAGKRDVNDPRNSLFRHYLRFIDAYRPRVAVLENVRLLTSMKSPHGGYVRDEIKHEFLERGYATEMFDVNAKNYGVPQHRERVFFIAARISTGIKPSFPVITHDESENKNLFYRLQPLRTFGDACSDLPYLESGELSVDKLHTAVAHPEHVINWLWDVPEGLSAHDNKESEKRPPSGYNTTYKRQVWDEPGATVQTTFGMISGCRNVHPIATRSLTGREAARLQSFPDSYKFDASLGDMRTGIGNAVPPLLAYQIALHLRQFL
jgi:DNA (cytosine-5)-methyltransferase 1